MISCRNDDQIFPVIFHRFIQDVDCLLSEITLLSICKGIRLINK